MADQRSIEERLDAVTPRAVAVWGAPHQMGKVQEECGELIAAIFQHADGRLTTEELAMEVADVIITVEQARRRLGSVVDRAVLHKLGRLEARLDAAEAERG